MGESVSMGLGRKKNCRINCTFCLQMPRRAHGLEDEPVRVFITHEPLALWIKTEVSASSEGNFVQIDE